MAKNKTNNSAPTSEEVVVVEMGRPINLESKRQKQMLERELKRQTGGLKKGRPIDGTSKRQQHLNDVNAKKEAGIESRPGRPAYTAEEKLAADAKKDERAAAEKVRIQEMAAQLLKLNNGDASAINIDEVVTIK